MLRDLASLWIGPRLGPVELASIRSFQRQGHGFTVFTYDSIENCPEGVDLRDAREILDLGRIFLHHRTKSSALHSDFFRYALIAKSDFVWVDLDMIALKPFNFVDDYIFGYEDVNMVNCAVLSLPKTSRTLQRLLSFDPETRGMPPGVKGLRKFKLQVKNLLSGGLPVEKWPWGSVGPKLVTAELQASGEISKALPISAFYSVPLGEAHRFADPDGYDPVEAPEDAYGVHLWASNLRRHVNATYGGQLPKDSFVNRVLHDHW